MSAAAPSSSSCGELDLRKLLDDCVLSPPSDSILVRVPASDASLPPVFTPLPFQRLHQQLAQKDFDRYFALARTRRIQWTGCKMETPPYLVGTEQCLLLDAKNIWQQLEEISKSWPAAFKKHLHHLVFIHRSPKSKHVVLHFTDAVHAEALVERVAMTCERPTETFQVMGKWKADREIPKPLPLAVVQLPATGATTATAEEEEEEEEDTSGSVDSSRKRKIEASETEEQGDHEEEEEKDKETAMSDVEEDESEGGDGDGEFSVVCAACEYDIGPGDASCTKFDDLWICGECNKTFTIESLLAFVATCGGAVRVATEARATLKAAAINKKKRYSLARPHVPLPINGGAKSVRTKAPVVAIKEPAKKKQKSDSDSSPSIAAPTTKVFMLVDRHEDGGVYFVPIHKLPGGEATFRKFIQCYNKSDVKTFIDYLAAARKSDEDCLGYYDFDTYWSAVDDAIDDGASINFTDPSNDGDGFKGERLKAGSFVVMDRFAFSRQVV
jgi:hypothetical protein